MEETARMHYRASLVVGPHGSGLSNFWFMVPKRSGAVEVFPAQGNGNGGYGGIADVLGIAHRFLRMNATKVPFGQAYPVENITQVLEAMESVLEELAQ